MKDFAQIIDVFFNGRSADKAHYKVNRGYPFGGGIERGCPKCGTPMASMTYEPLFKRIDLRCVGGCGYRWSAQPLDSQSDAAGVTKP